ncbi:MAG: DEAD/DEAH box helicase family protein, partial [Haloferacaceae archaeon]
MERLRLTFEEGTIRVAPEGSAPADEDELASLDLPAVEFDPRSKSGRAPAFRYADLREALAAAGIAVEDDVLDLEALDLDSPYQLREYQREALSAWREAGDRGVLELPTGSGKTVIGIAAIEALATPTLVVVPTIDLLDQWVDELQASFECPIGRLGGGSQRVEAITVSTYDSAYLRADELGDRFGLVVFDEVHHLGG